MKRKNIEKLLSDICEKLKQVSGQAAMTIINTLLNLVETLLEENEAKSKEIQKLQDEVNLLKGEQGKPDINKESKDKKNVSLTNQLATPDYWRATDDSS